ncbi:unnamed protein product [Phytomonas sp. Hart1]|nr:unnamed protein product [Phytomonas sp. Hart1]|eukprot:CCW71590.1 unnamed protein product [Phytomonas sp. isolate Hart1]
MEISPRDAFRISETIAPGASVKFIFNTHGGATINVKVLDDKNHVIQFWEGAVEGSLRLDAGTTPRGFAVVFDNQHSLFSTRRVSFFFHEDISSRNRLDVSQLDPIEGGVEIMSETVDNMFKYQVMLRDQQKRHRATIEASNLRILLWAIFQILTLMVMSFLQIYFLKRFLERKTFI